MNLNSAFFGYLWINELSVRVVNPPRRGGFRSEEWSGPEGEGLVAWVGGRGLKEGHPEGRGSQEGSQDATPTSRDGLGGCV